MGASITDFLASVHPYDTFAPEQLAQVASLFQEVEVPADHEIYHHGKTAAGLYLIRTGRVAVTAPDGTPVSLLRAKNSFGERGLMRDGYNATTARAVEPSTLLLLPAAKFHDIRKRHPAFAQFFARARAEPGVSAGVESAKVCDVMTPDPVTCTPETPVAEAALRMRDARISSLMVVDGGGLVGIVTLRDMSGKVVADGLPGETPVAQIMTPDPEVLSPDAIGSDVLHMMAERQISHVPVVEAGALVGIVTQANLTRAQSESTAHLVGDIVRAADADAIAATTARIPQLLARLVGAGHRHDVVTRHITDVADAATRRLLALGEATLGPPPVPYCWLACGSQGRQEQTGTSDQDNCLILDDAAIPEHDAYFAKLARFVCAGLDRAGYVFCPGEMMASTPRWRQPLSVWRGYFDRWIASPDPEAQMLASVMFDLRVIGGEPRLFRDVQTQTLARASTQSIFVAHMVSNSLKHTPPLGLIRGFATLRSGEHKNQIDMKMNGVVPVVDLARIYALRGALEPVNTRARITAAIEAKTVSARGGRDLLGAYDLIAQTRLDHQAAQVRAGARPDNYLSPAALSDFERSHLRDAFVVVRTMQSAAPQGAALMN